jgi:anti-sigma regulatory factor (Ser/Thr protein kinase)
MAARGMGVRRTVRRFDRDACEVPRVRHMVVDRLGAWGLGHEGRALELVVSELFTNAVRHGGGDVEVGIALDDDVVRVEVRDGGGGRPVLRQPDPTGSDPGGWGLHVVDQLADSWGSEVTGGVTLVWAERAGAARSDGRGAAEPAGTTDR